MAISLYIASLLGAAGLILLMPKKGERSLPLTLLGTLFVAAMPGLVWIFGALEASSTTGDSTQNTSFLQNLSSGIGLPGMVSYYVFSTISILSAVRVITHHRPVYAALWFVMVVLASAGLFLTLAAEFLAFAVILIYAGAILVTYMFVIMLATQARSASMTDADLPTYERQAREPIAAVTAGFLMLAVVLTVAFNPNHAANPSAKGMSDKTLAQTVLSDQVKSDEAAAILADAEENQPLATISNADRIGVDLFRNNPLGLELAGVILLVALVGAVVIAYTKVDTEDDAIAAEREDEKALATAAPGSIPSSLTS